MVEVFRTKRPVSVAGIAQWDPANRDDPVTAYVVRDGVHHVRHSWDAASEASSNMMLLSWLVDQPQDGLVDYVGEVLGEETLVTAAESAEAAGELWLASCRWAAAAKAALRSKRMSEAVEHLKKADGTLCRLELGAHASQQVVEQMELLELAVVKDICSFDLTMVDAMQTRLKQVMASNCAKAQPDMTYNLMAVALLLPHFMTSDVQEGGRVCLDMVSFLVSAGREGSPDPAMADYCMVCLVFIVGFFFDSLLLTPKFTWSALGESGEHCLRCIDGYDYDKHHFKLIVGINQDFMVGYMGVNLPLALHFGNIDAVCASIDCIAAIVPRCLAEPNQNLEELHKMFACAQPWPYLLGKGEQMAAVIGQILGSTWTAIDESCDAITSGDGNPFFAPRRAPLEIGSAPQFRALEARSWPWIVSHGARSST